MSSSRISSEKFQESEGAINLRIEYGA